MTSLLPSYPAAHGHAAAAVQPTPSVWFEVMYRCDQLTIDTEELHLKEHVVFLYRLLD